MKNILVRPNRAYTLRDGQVHQEVDAIRFAVAHKAEATGRDGPVMRCSAVWKFHTARKGADFFVTSNGIQSEMKGTVHSTQAHFGFASHLKRPPKTWVGPEPDSRHFHVLPIPQLVEGEFFPIFSVTLSGFALMKAPQPFDTGKVVSWCDRIRPECYVVLGLVVAEGDWRNFLECNPNEAIIGLLTGAGTRHALITFTHGEYDDVAAAIKNAERNLGLIGQPPISDDLKDEDLSMLFWMNREPNAPIKMWELNNIRHLGRR